MPPRPQPVVVKADTKAELFEELEAILERDPYAKVASIYRTRGTDRPRALVRRSGPIYRATRRAIDRTLNGLGNVWARFMRRAA